MDLYKIADFFLKIAQTDWENWERGLKKKKREEEQAARVFTEASKPKPQIQDKYLVKLNKLITLAKAKIKQIESFKIKFDGTNYVIHLFFMTDDIKIMQSAKAKIANLLFKDPYLKKIYKLIKIVPVNPLGTPQI